MLRIIGDGEHAKVVCEAVKGSWRAFFSGGWFLAIGDIAARLRLAALHREDDWFNVFHPEATISRRAHFGGGVYVGPGAIINAGAAIGDHVIVNTGAIIEHDVNVGMFCNVNPGAIIGGGTKIGRRTTLGLGCRIRDHITIGSDVTVGMGAVVVADVPDGVTVMGCPARIVE